MKSIFFIFFSFLILSYQQNRTIAISDIHLGSQWLNASHNIDKVYSILEQIPKANPKVSTLVLVGDIYDLWSYKFQEAPPSTEQIITGQRNGADISKFNSLLQKVISSGTKVIYVRGEHDMELEQSDLDKVFNGSVVLREKYFENGVLYEHGNQNDLFNMYYKNNTQRPIGYYLVRTAVTYDFKKPNDYNVVRNLLRLMNLPVSARVIGYFKSTSIMKDALVIAFGNIVPDNVFENHQYMNITKGDWYRLGKNVTLNGVVVNYSDMFQYFGTIYTDDQLYSLYLGSTGNYYDYIANLPGDVQNYVFGHTHQPLSGHVRLTGYYNLGSFVNTEVVYADITLNKNETGGSKTKIELKKYENNIDKGEAIASNGIATAGFLSFFAVSTIILYVLF